MNGRTSRRIRKLMQVQFRVLEIYIKSKKIAQDFKGEVKEDLDWSTIYRNIKKFYRRNIKDREFFETLMKKENI